MKTCKGVIGVFSSSYPITAEAPEAAARAAAYLQSRGWQVKLGELAGKRDFYRSGTIRERAAEFNHLLRDPEVTHLMASVGGMVSNALLPYIDYGFLREHPKPVIGLSDAAALLLGIYQKTGQTTYYGPNLVTVFGQRPPLLDFSLERMEAVLGGSPLPLPCPMPPVYSDEPTDWSREVPERTQLPNRWVTVRPGIAEGRLLGGNLNTISGIMGSPYMPDFREGDILFLEDTEKFAAHAERYFAMLSLCGALDKAGGIILGKHRKFDDQGTGRTPADILLELLDGRDIPILADVDCCHTVPMLTLPIGGTVRLDAGERTITILRQ
ncbi:MAG: LD-carboxypeptidase [Oscillospiraceae bacterium]|nr:LD-carboxypeptidase [Oscillospiraceae bacterium]